MESRKTKRCQGDDGWIPLHGGNVNTVARKDEIVRRQTGPASPAVHQLLAWLHSRKLQQIPRLLEVTGNQEFLTFLPGKPVFRPWPEEVKTGRWMAQLGDWLQRYHHAVEGFRLQDNAAFSWGPADPEPGMVVCHGDLGPWNCLQQKGALTGIIDWDLAHYGDPIDDVAEVALEAVPLHPRMEGTMGTGTPDSVLWARLELFCEAYSSIQPSSVVRHIPTYLARIAQDTRDQAERGTEPFVSFVEGGIARDLEQDKAYVLAKWVSGLPT